MLCFRESITNNKLLITRNLKFHWNRNLKLVSFCKDGFEDDSPANIVYKKRLEKVIRVSEEKDVTELLKCLLGLKNSNQEVKVHHSCRQKFTVKRTMSLTNSKKKTDTIFKSQI